MAVHYQLHRNRLLRLTLFEVNADDYATHLILNLQASEVFQTLADQPGFISTNQLLWIPQIIQCWHSLLDTTRETANSCSVVIRQDFRARLLCLLT